MRLREAASPEEAGIDPRGLERLTRLVEGHVARGCYPGAVLLVARNGLVAYRRAFGYRSLYPEREEMTLDTVFDMASVTKVVATTTLALQAVEEGLVSLQDPVKTYFPAFTGGGKDGVTLWHLLTHTSGLPAHIHLYSILTDPGEAAGYIASLPLQYEPGTRVVYSDLGMILLGKILEHVFGERLDEAARRRIFEPLGMGDTTYLPPPPLRERAAATEYCPLRKRILRGEVHDENAWFLGGVSGHAGLFSTADDLAVFAEALLEGGSLGGARVLSEASVREATRLQTPGLNERRGLGWALRDRPCSCGDLLSERAFGHTGFTGTSLWVDPSYRLIVVFLTNRVHPTRENRCLLRARKLVHNVVAASLLPVGDAKNA